MVMCPIFDWPNQKKIWRLIVSKGDCPRTKDTKVQFEQELSRRDAAKKETRTKLNVCKFAASYMANRRSSKNKNKNFNVLT